MDIAGKWICPWHSCDEETCGKKAHFFCSMCPNSFCIRHNNHTITQLSTGRMICDEHPPTCPQLQFLLARDCQEAANKKKEMAGEGGGVIGKVISDMIGNVMAGLIGVVTTNGVDEEEEDGEYDDDDSDIDEGVAGMEDDEFVPIKKRRLSKKSFSIKTKTLGEVVSKTGLNKQRLTLVSSVLKRGRGRPKKIHIPPGSPPHLITTLSAPVDAGVNGDNEVKEDRADKEVVGDGEVNKKVDGVEEKGIDVAEEGKHDVGGLCDVAL